jgi:hypothetical protein
VVHQCGGVFGTEDLLEATVELQTGPVIDGHLPLQERTAGLVGKENQRSSSA